MDGRASILNSRGSWHLLVLTAVRNTEDELSFSNSISFRHKREDVISIEPWLNNEYYIEHTILFEAAGTAATQRESLNTILRKSS